MILVDCNPEHGTRYPYMMVATCGREELVEFGKKLGLKAEWIRRDAGVEHFRVNAIKRSEAIAKGAREASMKEIVEATERAA